jgi:dihydroorotate dehydrogenase (fumarate)
VLLSLSGRPLFERNLKLIKYAYQQTNGEFLIIGTGGVFSTEDAIKMMRHGASLIQIYSSLVIDDDLLSNVRCLCSFF